MIPFENIILYILKFVRNQYHWIIIIALIIYALYMMYEKEIQNQKERSNIISNNLLKKKTKIIKEKYYRQVSEKKEQINEKKNNKMHLIENNNNDVKEEIINHYLSLKDLYYNGIPDKYDTSGFKIRGIPPNPELAIQYLNLAINDGYLYGLIELGQMYHYGFYNFPSDLKKAEEIYNYIINNIHDQKIIDEAIDLYYEASNEKEKITTHKWLNLPYTSTIQPKKTLYEIEQKSSQQKSNKNFPTALIFGTPEININNLFRTARETNQEIMNVNDPNINLDVNQQRIRNDMHNVHDHSVIATIKQSIEKLKKDTLMTKDNSQCIREIRQYLGSLPNNDKKKDALHAIDAAEKNYLPLSFTDLKEIEVLALVWNRMNSDKHSDTLNVLKENLADELAECIEHDKPVCSTGRISRILDTLNMVDEAVNIKPSFIINEEMMNRAAKIRDDDYSNLSDEDKKLVDNIINNDFQKQWTDNLKEKIKTQLYDDYVKSDILTEHKFKEDIKEWIDEI